MKRDKKQGPKKTAKSKKKERSQTKGPNDEGSKWQEFLRRHSKAEEQK